MCGEEHSTKQDAKTTHDKIGDAKERVFASHDCAG
jgi:hypothetical protein